MNVAQSNNTMIDGASVRFPQIVAIAFAIYVLVAPIGCAQSDLNAQVQQADTNTTVTQIEGPANVAADDVRFEAIDVFVSTGESSLAAYQFELHSVSSGVEIVGIEGGDHAAFAEPPYYDSKAMNNNRVKLAAFSTAKQLPSGRSRVARIHLQLEGPGPKEYHTKLSVSANADGEDIPAKIEVEKARL